MVLGVVGLLAIPAAPAFAGNAGDGSGYHPQGSDCGQAHGAFGFFGKDLNLGVNSRGPGTPTYHDGATGQDPGATGYNNSHTDCQG